MNIIGYGFFYLTCHTIAMRWQTNTYIITLWYIKIQHSCCFFDTIDYFVWGNSTSNKLQNLSLINKIIGHVYLLIYYLFLFVSLFDHLYLYPSPPNGTKFVGDIWKWCTFELQFDNLFYRFDFSVYFISNRIPELNDVCIN